MSLRWLMLVAMVTITLVTEPAVAGPAETPTEGGAGSTSRAITFLEERIRQDPDDIVALNLLAHRHLDRLRTVGGDADLERAMALAQQSLKSVPETLNPGGLEALVRVHLAGHRFADAEQGATRLVALLPDRGMPLRLLGDAEFELGKIDQAANTYAKAREVEAQPVEDAYRLARVATVKGLLLEAETHMANVVKLTRAATLPSAELIAWAEVQQGRLRFAQGKWEQAEANYRRALSEQPRDISAEDHLAELAAAKGDYATAIAGFRSVITRSPRPEFRQALGDVLAIAQQPDEAKRWHAQALAGYLDSVRAGHVHYFHHLAGFFCDSQPNGPEAVRWARADLALRQSPAALDAYAWALYTDGQFAQAHEQAQLALASGTRDAHVFYHAGLIASRHGDIVGGAKLLRRAVEANPRHNSFHVHR